MDTKEKILQEFGCPEIPYDENVTMYYPAICSAMDAHARNCMIEIIKWYTPSMTTFKNPEKIVDGFLQSEYFKELQK